nr:hypothetical protein [Chitinophagaceae bacterium]
MKQISLIIVIGIFIFPSCRSAKKIQAPVVIKDTVIAEVKLPDVVLEDTAAIIKSSYNLLQNNLIKVSTFSAKVDVK